MQTIKNFRSIAGLILLGATLTFAGCNGCGKPANPDSGKTDSSMKKTDSVKTDSAMKKTDSTKMAPADSGATPPSHVPQKDTSVDKRPLIRKT